MRAASRDLLGKNNNGCAEPRIRAQAGSRSGAGPRPARPSQSPAARLLPGGRPILQHHDVCGDGTVRHHLLSSPRSRQPAGHDAASRRDDLGVSGGAADAADRPQHRLPRRLAVRHGGRHRHVHRAVHRQLPRHVRRRPHPRLRGRLPADVPLRRGGTGADPLPRQGDFMGDGRRRRRRRDRPQPRARDARSDDAALPCDLCRDSRACTSSFSRSCPSSASPRSRRRPRPPSQAEIAAPPRPLLGDCQPAALHRVCDGRHAGVRHDVVHHERVAAGHRRLRISACGGPLGHLHACAGHVRAIVLHRQSDQPVSAPRR